MARAIIRLTKERNRCLTQLVRPRLPGPELLSIHLFPNWQPARASSSSSTLAPVCSLPPTRLTPLHSRKHSALHIQSRISNRAISYVAMSSSTNNTADPVERTTSPYPDPRQIGPKSKILATRTSNYHSTSLRNMVTAHTVNKTALHPGGVQYVYTLIGIVVAGQSY
jgi:hypothetical protein